MRLSLQTRTCGAILGLLFVGIGSASADVFHVLPAMGNLQSTAVFSLGGGFFGSFVSGNSYIGGDVMVSGNGNIALIGPTTIDGELYCRSNGTAHLLGGAVITGGVYYGNDTEIDDNAIGANSASNDASAMAPNRAFTNIKLGGRHGMAISGAPGETVAMTLRNFRLSGNAVLTLQGTATTTFVINVNRQFSLSGNAKIVLSGGLQWNNILFNVRGAGRAAAIKGNASFEGILLATGRTVVISGNSTVTGEIIANRLLMGGASRVIHPPIVSQ